LSEWEQKFTQAEDEAMEQAYQYFYLGERRPDTSGVASMHPRAVHDHMFEMQEQGFEEKEIFNSLVERVGLKPDTTGQDDDREELIEENAFSLDEMQAEDKGKTQKESEEDQLVQMDDVDTDSDKEVDEETRNLQFLRSVLLSG